MGKTHVAGGILSGTTVLLLTQKAMPELCSLSTGLLAGISVTYFSGMSARLPDFDKKDSTIGRRLWFISWPLYILQLFFKFLSFFGIKTFESISKIIDHRGITHFPLTWCLITAFTSFYAYSIYSATNLLSSTKIILISPAAGLSIGILSHLLLDFISGKIKLFAPISLKGYGIILVKRNSLLEHIIRIAMHLINLFLIYHYLQNIFHFYN